MTEYNVDSSLKRLIRRGKSHTGPRTIDSLSYSYTQDRMHGLDWHDFGARRYDAVAVFFTSPDPLSEKYYHINPYVYCVGNPIRYIDPDGCDTIVVYDQNIRPLDNGTKNTSYTADVVVIQNGVISGIDRGSSYPNSVSNNDNSTNYNTLKENTEICYNNEFGHKGGSEKGLNLVNNEGERYAPGFDKDGNDVLMINVNVHSGYSDNGNYNSRGSQGCVTIHPDDSDDFFSNFQWNEASNVGTSTGSIFIIRNKKHENETSKNPTSNDWVDYNNNLVNGL